MMVHSFFQLCSIIILMMIVRYILSNDKVIVYENNNKKKARSVYGFDLYKRLLFKKTGRILGITEYLYFLMLFALSTLIFTLVPLFESNTAEGLSGSEILYITLLMFCMSVLILLPPKRLLLLLGKEYFATKAMTQLLAVFIIFIMSYVFGTLRFSEAIVYQSTQGFIGLPNWGIILSPVLFLCYITTVVFSLKANSKNLQVTAYSELEATTGLKTMLSIYTDLMMLVHLLILTTLFFGGHSFPYIDKLLDSDIYALKAGTQLIASMLKVTMLVFLLKHINREVVLKSDYRLNRYKMIFLYPLLLIGLLILPIINYVGG